MRRGRGGATLIEVMLAAAILSLMVLALFEGIAVSARIARENAEYLQADAYAFDLAWKRFNESYGALRSVLISVDVEWGARRARRRLSSSHTATVFKGGGDG